jgi:hypothetical protein
VRTHRSTRSALLIAAAAWLAAAPAAAQEAADAAPAPSVAAAAATSTPDPTWYAQSLARGEAGLNVTHFWSKGPRLRSETVVAGHKVITIVNGDWYYAYDGLTSRGLAIRRDPAAIARDASLGRPFGNEYRAVLRQGAEIVREETLLGRRTGVFRVTDDLGRRELWATLDDDRLPLRLEIYDRRTSKSRVIDYLNWQSEMAIPDGFFQPEPTAQLEELSLEEYLARTSRQGPVGPVPVLYLDLLHVKRDETGEPLTPR